MNVNSEGFTKLDIFKGIQKADLQAMIDCLGCYRIRFEKGEYISFEHENLRSVGIVLSGTVHMIKEDVWGNVTIVARMTKGQLFGESFVCGTDNLSTVSFLAAEDAEVLMMPFDRVMHTCSRSCMFHHRIVENMVVMLANKNRSLMEKIEVVSKKSLREKILAYLSLESQKQGTKYFEVPMGRVELANYLSTDRSALTRELSNMKKAGLLDYDKNMFHLY